MCNTTSDNTYLNYLNNYFGKFDESGKLVESPVCREERQYALFLYNKLLSLVKKDSYDKEDKGLLEKIGLNKNAKILKVYYEVTFMRDFFYKNKCEKIHNFNGLLFKFVELLLNNKYINDSIREEIDKLIDSPLNDINYGSNSKKNKEFKQNFPIVSRFISAMMNNKADIGILYEDLENKRHLKLIECKYESGVDVYDFGNNFKMPQYVIQYYITKFICEKLFPKDEVKAEYPVLVSFKQKNKNSYNACECCDKHFECEKDKEKDYCIKYLSYYIEKKLIEISLNDLIPDNLKNNEKRN